MMSSQLDLSACEREKIHQPGFIQPHGYLLALSDDFNIEYVSQNTKEFLRRDADELLGRNIAEFHSQEELARFEKAIGQAVKTPTVYLDGAYNTWLHQWNGQLILERELRSADEDRVVLSLREQVRTVLADLEAQRSLYALSQSVVESIAAISGYDRVMVYSFHEDWSGEVIAEYRESEAEPFIGLRYPATDIPPQARLLYTLNHLRVITSVAAPPVPILAVPNKQPLDLSYSVLRAVSPYHIQYLQNMGVGATLTASLMVNGRLWGLIACHHPRRKIVLSCWREALEKVARKFSERVEALDESAAKRAVWRTARYVQIFAEETPTFDKLAHSVILGESRFHNLFQADSLAIYSDGVCAKVGNTPSTPWIAGLAGWMLEQDEDIFYCSESAAFPVGNGLAPEDTNNTAGVMAIIVSRNPAVIIFCFRTEHIHHIHWGGDIAQPALQDPQSKQLSPRRSFAVYRQTIAGRSQPWTASDLQRAKQLAHHMQSLLPEDPVSISKMLSASISEVMTSLQSTSPLHRSLLDLVAEGVSLFLDATPGTIVPRYANRALLELFQLDGPDTEDRTDFASFLERAGLPPNLCELARTEPQQVKIVNSFDRVRHFLVQHKHLFSVETATDHRSLTAITFSDITRFAQSIEALEFARRQADRANQIKSSFLANMSHEIRTPMNGILGMTQVLMNTALNPEQQQCMEAIQHSGDALLTLINDILDLSKIEAGKLELEKIPFDLRALALELVRLLSPQAAAKQIGLRLHYDKATPRFVVGDPGRLRQILTNLVGNAIKFTSKGQVTITVQEQSSTLSEASLLFSIQDTGIGIPEDRLSMLFQKFQQVDHSTTRKYGGTGLGLAICKELVTLMGGTIKVSSEPGEGSTFSFSITLPIDGPQLSVLSGGVHSSAAVPEKTAALPLPAATPDVARTKVLLVEDNAINQRVALAFLARLNSEVEVASSGKQAVAMYQNACYDLILMDCQMPEMDGFETTVVIRQLERATRRTPIIALTANAMREDQERCLAAGMDDYMAKPVSFIRLQEVLKKWSEGRVNLPL
jgi:light-regulated signal transduction histidine kinase (bacteriophytochrome)/ActR/RegA family two-component response regulator